MINRQILCFACEESWAKFLFYQGIEMNSIDFYQIKRNTVEVDSLKWNIDFYKGFEKFIFAPELDIQIKNILTYINMKNYDLPFRFNVSIGTIQVLCGFVPKSKTVYIATKQLSHELTLTKNSQDDTFFDSIHLHAQKIATIPLNNTPPNICFITFDHELADFNDEVYNDVHAQTEMIAKDLVTKVSLYKQTLFEKISDIGLDLTANYMLVRIHLLKFLAILPSLDHDQTGTEVKRSLLEAIRRLIKDSKIATRKKLKALTRAIPS